jgi:hypothetical protein
MRNFFDGKASLRREESIDGDLRRIGIREWSCGIKAASPSSGVDLMYVVTVHINHSMIRHLVTSQPLQRRGFDVRCDSPHQSLDDSSLSDDYKKRSLSDNFLNVVTK